MPTLVANMFLISSRLANSMRIQQGKKMLCFFLSMRILVDVVSRSKEWTGEYSTDYQDLLPGKPYYNIAVMLKLLYNVHVLNGLNVGVDCYNNTYSR